ncbi:hypothetical protein QTP70_013783 [Hemibagrus guttatus]|uniref:Retinitis pigmentosa 1-like 1 protein n=1 Tax=Hemibagrus guttatus TaxID=175788 RepID=A0AAE0QYU9_9TELE|nr:hypothetical protein QTP70_013783 [Hemibagrus guttatus]
MISELKEEVHKRIQSTINRELQKIQSRAGKTPRPPISMLSRDSTVKTEQRRRRLKVMQDKLINPSRSEYINSVSGTEFSDQRSEDEYCPCDACMKKKMASRVVQCAEALNVPPVLKEFDLRRILQTKKDPPVNMPVQSKLDEQKDQSEGADSSSVKDKNNLEVVREVKEEAILTEHEIQENQDKDVGVINDGVRTGPSEEPSDEKMFDGNIDRADDGDSKTERERHEVGEDLEDKYTDKKDEEEMNREDEEAEEATEGNTKLDEEVAMEKGPPDELAAERKKTECSDIEEGEGNPVEEKESIDEKAEEEVSEGELNKQSKTGEAEEEKRDEIEEKAEIPEEGEETENRTGEETQSAKEGKISGDESGEDENSNETSDEQTQDDAPAAAAVAKPRKNKKAEIIQGEKTEEDGTTRTSEAKISTKNSADENQSESIEKENEFEKESHDSKGKTCIQKPTKKKDNISVAGQLVSEEEEEEEEEEEDGDIDGYGTDEKHQTDTSADSIERQEKGPDPPSQTYGDESDCKLITQLTKTSVESQTGSLEYSTNMMVKEKLRDIQSLMESLNDQGS